jgi:hypothetical protein
MKIKKPREKHEATHAAPSLAKGAGFDGWEGVLTYGIAPITVAGPWPILTAFPASQACKMSKEVYVARRVVSTVAIEARRVSLCDVRLTLRALTSE